MLLNLTANLKPYHPLASEQHYILYSIAQPSIKTASGEKFLDVVSNFNEFSKTAFDVGYLPSPVSLKIAVNWGLMFQLPF